MHNSDIELPEDISEEVIPFLQEMGYLDAERLQVGDMVPPIELAALGGGHSITIGGESVRPVVLIFGSYT